jgi:hypothetical protein
MRGYRVVYGGLAVGDRIYPDPQTLPDMGACFVSNVTQACDQCQWHFKLPIADHQQASFEKGY